MSTVQYKQEERGTNGTLRLLSHGARGSRRGRFKSSRGVYYARENKHLPIIQNAPPRTATRGRRELCEVKHQPEGLIERKRKEEEMWSGG